MANINLNFWTGAGIHLAEKLSLEKLEGTICTHHNLACWHAARTIQYSLVQVHTARNMHAQIDGTLYMLVKHVCAATHSVRMLHAGIFAFQVHRLSSIASSLC